MMNVLATYVRIQVRRFVKSERGANIVEYGLIAALIAVALIVTLKAFGGKLADVFTRMGSQIDGTVPKK